MRWTLEGELPDGLVFNPAGAISGVPRGLGEHTVTVTVTDADGRSDAADLPLSVVLSSDLLYCGGAMDGELTEGAARGWYDVDWDATGGYAWLEVPLPSDDMYAYTFSGGTIEVELAPSTYPDLGRYRETGVSTMAYAYYGSTRELTLTLTCDRTPLPDLYGLPVLEESAVGAWQLDAIGGTPPYTFTAEGLPDGVTLSVDGLLASDAPAAGTSTIDLSVVDAAGATSTTTWPLFVGADAACLGHPQLGCGDGDSGTFEEPYWNDWYGTANIRTWCVPPAVTASAELFVTVGAIEDAMVVLEASNPGNTDASGGFWTGGSSFLTWADGAIEVGVLSADSWPALPDYTDLPMFLTLAAWEAGDWSIDLDCE